MHTHSRLMRYFSSLAPGQIFSTRQLIPLCEKRHAVDVVLSRLVRKGYLERLTRGVFRVASDVNAEVSFEEIANARARSFGREIIEEMVDLESSVGSASCEIEGPEDINVASMRVRTFLVEGNSSSFQIGGVKVRLKSISKQKVLLGTDKLGTALRGLLLCKDRNVNQSVMAFKFSREEWGEINKRRSMLPGEWSDLFAYLSSTRPRPRALNGSRQEPPSRP